VFLQNRLGRDAPEVVRIAASLEIGLLSEGASELDANLATFGKAVTTALARLGNESKSTLKPPGWLPPAPESARLAGIIARSQEENIKFDNATLEPAEVSASTSLSQNLASVRFLQDLSQAGFVRGRDLQSRPPKKREELREGLELASNNGLINTELLLECRRSGIPLTRLADHNQLAAPAVSNLTCPSCGSPFAKELTTEGYLLSDLGKRLTTKSHWMTVWLTNLLSSLGVAPKSILWNLSESSEEIDILAEVFGELWVFELKDREFGAGDAYPFNYRRALKGLESLHRNDRQGISRRQTRPRRIGTRIAASYPGILPNSATCLGDLHRRTVERTAGSCVGDV
jgi:hypothetical protein